MTRKGKKKKKQTPGRKIPNTAVSLGYAPGGKDP
jgi:hypothetical protein